MRLSDTPMPVVSDTPIEAAAEAARPLGLAFDTTVMHARRRPHAYRFRYRVFSVLWEVDALETLAADDARAASAPDTAPSPARRGSEARATLRGFRFDRRGWITLHRRDHGPRDGSDWRMWLKALLDAHQLPGDRVGRLRLLAMPRVLGLGFNPLSIWYCDDRDGAPLACVLEVRNTFGEHHHYVLDARAGYPLRARRDKVFHVSPFIDMTPRYDFRIEAPPDAPGERLGVFIRESDAYGHLLTATQTGVAQALTSGRLLRAVSRAPWMPIQVLALIHWQALKIWLRGTPFHRHPNLRSRGSV